MAREFGEEIFKRNLSSDGFLRRFIIKYYVNHPLGDNFLLSKEGERDNQYGFYKNGNVQTGVKPGYDIVSITYEDLIGDGNHYRYLYKGGTNAIPLEQKTGTAGDTMPWLPYWNHYVVEKAKDKDSVVAATWEAATKLSDTSGEGFGHWMRSNQAMPTGGDSDTKTVVVVEALKPGVNSFLVPTATVTEIVYTRNRHDDLHTFVSAQGKLKTPANAFGLTGGGFNWLVRSVNAERMSDWYKVVIEYNFMAYGWDIDLYEDGPTSW